VPAWTVKEVRAWSGQEKQVRAAALIHARHSAPSIAGFD
jgi:hypothetical protein